MKDLRDIAKPHYVRSYRWEHAKRVHFLVTLIGAEEGADLAILEPAAYFHDCMKDSQHDGDVDCHAKAGAKKAREVLAGLYSNDDINKIAQCIAVHRFTQNLPATTLEGKILQDADRLDRIGEEAVMRDVDYLEKAGTSPYTSKEGFNTITCSYKKKLMLKPDTFNTETARKLAEDRYHYTKTFMDGVVQEWSGK